VAQQGFPVQYGEFRLLRRIAQGGMAEIFLAQDAKGQICALKRILPHLAHEEGFIRMFIDEARIVSHLDHPNVARVYKQDKHEGYYYIAMEYVEGHSLLALGDRAKSNRIPLPRGLLAYIVAELLAGLAAAHSARDAKGRHLAIVHRDVTPQNVLISYDGLVKLIDFGVAKARARLTKTEAGFTKGKLSYMSPEQAKGEELDGRSDLFSVGIILYEITTGTRLFNKEGPGGILGAIVNDTIPPPSSKDKNYPKDLEAIVMRALEKGVDRRWQSADEMRDALLRYSRKEKPAPGRKRLADLVQDLFGDPENKKLIDAAHAVVEPTPAGEVKAEMVRGESVRIQGSKVPELGTDVGDNDKPLDAMPPPDDTRMMPLDDRPKSSLSKSMPKLAATNPSVPAVNLSIPADEVRVPEPKVPPRVRFARGLADIAADAKAGFAVHKKKVVAIGGSIGMITAIVLLHLLGVTSVLAGWIGGSVDKAREFKRSQGLTNAPHDAGIIPTVLKLKSEPPGAAVTINGLGMGCVTPCELPDLPLGQTLKVELALQRYRTHTEKLQLWPNTGDKEVTIPLERQISTLAIESEPAGAIVLVGGKRLQGVTPLTYDAVQAGTPLKIDVEKSGFLPKSRVVVLEDGELKTESFQLELDQATIPPGKLQVTTVPGHCSVQIDGNLLGTSPVTQVVKAGNHSVKATCEFYSPETRTVSVRPGQTLEEKIVLEPSTFGYLTIHVAPEEGSEVRINNHPVAFPIEFLKVIPGRHVVDVKNARLDRHQSVTIDVGPDKRIERTISLY
jgi:serine/threonine-protein kinase